MIDETSEKAIRKRIRRILLENEEPRDKDSLLIAITHVCKLLEPIFEAEQWESLQPRLKKLTKDDPISKTVAHSLEEIQNAVTFVVANAG